ncbi:hypothetical protein GCM10009621_04590 [Corynebacterium felinum]
MNVRALFVEDSLEPWEALQRIAQGAIDYLKNNHGFTDTDLYAISHGRSNPRFHEFAAELSSVDRLRLALVIANNYRLAQGQFPFADGAFDDLKKEAFTKAEAKAQKQKFKAFEGLKPEFAQKKKYAPLFKVANALSEGFITPCTEALDACVEGRNYDSTQKPPADQGAAQWNTPTIIGVVTAIIAALGGLIAAVASMTPHIKYMLRL